MYKQAVKGEGDMRRQQNALCNKRACALAIPAVVSMMLGNVHAQEPQQGRGMGLEEIIVTATRREVSLSEVPISVAAYTQEQMDQQSVRSIQDIVRLTPGLNLRKNTQGNSYDSNISIRGIFSEVGAATVGVYINDTPVHVRNTITNSAGIPAIFDLERVEVLRGPQGTLYGSGSLGGTIRFITPEPGLTDYTAYGRAETAFVANGSPSYDLGMAIGGPLVDNVLGFRLSGYYGHTGGWVDHANWNTGKVDMRDANFADMRTVRAALKWKPSEQLTLSPSILYQDVKVNNSGLYWEHYSNPSAGEFINAEPNLTPTRDIMTLTSLGIEYEFEKMTLISATSFIDRDNTNLFDNSTLDLSIFTGQSYFSPPRELNYFQSSEKVQVPQRTLTQELRLQSNDPDARFSWVVGLFYRKNDVETTDQIDAPYMDDVMAYIGSPRRYGPLYYKGFFIYSEASTNEKDTAAFANVDIGITDRLKLNLGARYTQTKYETTTFSAGAFTPVPRTVHLAADANALTPKIGITYDLSKGNMVYASATKGFRNGSAAGPLSAVCTPDATALGISLDGRQIEPDYAWSYELGSKNLLLDGRLALDSSIYYIDWQKIQSRLALPNCGSSITANFGAAASKGFDVLARYRPSERITLGMAVGYTNAEYSEATFGANGKIMRPKGEPLPIAPWTVTASGEYNLGIFGKQGYVRADYQYSSHNSTPIIPAGLTPADLPLTDPTIPREPASSNLNVRSGVRLDSGFELSVFASNLTNQHPAIARRRDTMNMDVYFNLTVQPRTFGLTAAYRY